MSDYQFKEDFSKDRKQYLSLLLLADEDKKQLLKYLNDGRVFIIQKGTELVAISIVTFDNSRVPELKNIAVSSEFQGQGIGTMLIQKICEQLKTNYQQLIVGTGDADVQNILFYLKNGFRFIGVKKNFFLKYAEPIVSNGVTLKDMVMLEKDLS